MHIAIVIIALLAALMFLLAALPTTPGQPLVSIGWMLIAFCIALMGWGGR